MYKRKGGERKEKKKEKKAGIEKGWPSYKY